MTTSLPSISELQRLVKALAEVALAEYRASRAVALSKVASCRLCGDRSHRATDAVCSRDDS